jgi:hypothetical protein
MKLQTIVTTETLQNISRVDLLLCACGYESRARYAASLLLENSTLRIAIGFPDQKELAYEANEKWFKANNFTFHEPAEARFREVVDHAFNSALRLSLRPFVVIDISCLNRFRMAHIVDSLRNLNCDAINVMFVYSLAEFTPPPSDTAPTMVVEPVIPQFSGWTNAPDKPPAAVVGLGYEPSKAIGAIDHLEINNAVWLYTPSGPISEYLDRVILSNASLIELIQSEGRKLSYSVLDPGSLFQEINSLIDLLKGSYNPLLIPFGPKLFALVSLLVACVHEEAGVWRVSSGTLEEPVDRKPSQHVIGLNVAFVGEAMSTWAEN